MAGPSGMKRSLPKELSTQLNEIQGKIAKTSGDLFELEDNKKRWLLVGVGLHTILSPALRKYVKPELDNLWQTLRASDYIDTEHNSLEYYNGYYLNYEAINNNRRHQMSYYYSVKNSIDLSKLFLKTDMAKYSAFDEGCDASALLGIIINTGICPAGEKCAEQVRSDIRNDWAHCDYRDWTDAKYKKCSKLMNDLVQYLGFPHSEKKEILDQFDRWNQNGDKFIAGTTLELAGLTELKDHVQDLVKCVKSLADTPEQIEKIQKELSNIDQVLKEHGELLSEHTERIGQLETAKQEHTEKLGQIETAKQEHTEKIEQLETAKQEHSDKIGQLETAKQEHSEKLGQLETAKQEHSDKIGQLETAKQEHSEKIGQLETAKQEHSDKIGQLETAKQEHSEKLGQLETAKQEHSENLGQLETAKQEHSEKIGQLETAQQEQSDKIGQLETAQQEQSDKIGQVETAQQEHSDKIGQVEKETKDNTGSIAKLEKKIEEKEESIPKHLKGSNLENLDPDKRRWIMVGIELHTIISPALRKFVGTELNKLWDNLRRSKNIDNQQYPNQLKKYLSTDLNYGAINNNQVGRPRKPPNQYDYCIRNPVDLSKLFLKTHMAEYTAFDESCDASALLGIVINTGICRQQKAVDDAKRIRQYIRNMWAHCDFRKWDENKYQDCLNLMKQFIINLDLPTSDETEVLTKIEEENKKGRNFIDGINPEEFTLADIKTQTAILLKHVDRLADVPRDICKLERELTDINTDLTPRLANVERKTKDNTVAIAVNTSAIDECKKKMEEHESSIPKHMNETHENYVNGWEKEEKTFTVTRATKQVASLIKENNVVVVVGSSGSGKSSIIHHVALNLKAEHGYDIIPIVTSPMDIIHYRDVNKNQLFVIDDLCGKNYLDETDLEAWKNKSKIIEKLFPEPINEQGKLKILVSCRLQIFNTDKFKNLHLFTKEAVDLQSQKYCLLADEKLKMIQKYLKVTEEDWQEINKDLAGCQYFPLLCKLGQDKNVEEFKHLIASPIDCIRKDLRDTIQNKPMENCALVLCVLFPDGFHEDFIDPETRPQDVQQKITDIINTYEINLANERNRAHLSEAFERLDGTYVKKIGQEYSISHDKLFDMVAVECSNKVTELFIKYSPPTILEQLFRYRTLFEYNQDELLIYLKEKDEKKYFKRIFKDLEVNSYKPFFHNQQLKEEKYRTKVMEYIEQNKEFCDKLFRRLDREGMTEERKHYYRDDTYTYRTTPVIEATKTGFYDLVQYFIQINCDCNKKDSYDVSPLSYSCKNGFVKVTDLLMRHGVDEYGDELVDACWDGMMDVVRVMADSGVDLSVCDSEYGYTPLTAACFMGRSEIVKLLLDKGADPLQTDRWGDIALDVAREEGDDTIINLLKSHMKQ